MTGVRQYEVVYIAMPDATEETLADLHQQVVAVVDRFGGKIDRTEPWGRRRLAYDIGNQREGTYVLEVISGPSAMTAELDRRFRVTDAVIRHLIVRVDEELAVADRAKTRRKAATAARRVRRGLPPEPTETELHRRQAEKDDDLEAGADSGFRAGGDR
jgi:small subunit ribosomal protein S6